MTPPPPLPDVFTTCLGTADVTFEPPPTRHTGFPSRRTIVVSVTSLSGKGAVVAAPATCNCGCRRPRALHDVIVLLRKSRFVNLNSRSATAGHSVNTFAAMDKDARARSSDIWEGRCEIMLLSRFQLVNAASLPNSSGRLRMVKREDRRREQRMD
jgi:hypothetical protein